MKVLHDFENRLSYKLELSTNFETKKASISSRN
jgi:hypothetical protein